MTQTAENPLTIRVENVLTYIRDHATNVAQEIIRFLNDKYGEEFRVANMELVLIAMLLGLQEDEGDVERVITLIRLLSKIFVPQRRSK
jgi:hypothetical protein